MLMNEVMADAFGRIKEEVHTVLKGLKQDDLVYRPGKDANSIAWLVWHLTRIQDDHIADVANAEQVYTSGGWAEKFNLPFDDTDTGYGHTSQAVAAVQPNSELLLGYLDAVHEKTTRFLNELHEADYETIVDKNWNPPVTLAVRLISVISDDLQHIGQAAYIRGLIK